MIYNTSYDTVTIDGTTYDVERAENVGSIRFTVEQFPEVEVHIRQEDEPGFGDPRDASNVGTMLCGHDRYDLGHEQIGRHGLNTEGECPDCDGTGNERQDVTPMLVDCETCEGSGERVLDTDEYLRIERGARVILPLALYDHSGLTMWVGSGPHAFDSDGWDSGQVGVIFDTPAGVSECIGDDATDEQIEAALRSEVEEYDRYLRGEVYMVDSTVHGEFHDSVGGVLGNEYGEETAFEFLVDAIEDAIKERAERAEWAARDVLTA